MLTKYPLLFQVNTRVWLTELSRNLRRPAAWKGAGGDRLLVAVNYAPNRGRCSIRLPFHGPW
jgi:hypothetical protein